MTPLRPITLWVAAVLLGGSGGAAIGQTLVGTAEVIDGDTLRLEGQEVPIRLERIDAPETNQACENVRGSSYPCGVMAADKLRSLVEQGEVRCEAHGVDGEERPLATCFVGDLNVNAAMIVSGWAVEVDALSGGRYSDLEAEAERAGVGIWQGRFVDPWIWRGLAEATEPSDAEKDDTSEPVAACSIKGNISRAGRRYYLPRDDEYDRVKISVDRGERMFCSTEEARAAGWRPAHP